MFEYKNSNIYMGVKRNCLLSLYFSSFPLTSSQRNLNLNKLCSEKKSTVGLFAIDSYVLRTNGSSLFAVFFSRRDFDFTVTFKQALLIIPS